MAIIFALLIETLTDQLYYGVWWAWLLQVFTGLLMISFLVLISRQPVAARYNTFAVPFVPWLPGISIIINVYLMMMLDYMTWVRFAVWILLGLVIYFAYGMSHSNEGIRIQQKQFINNRQNHASLFTNSKEILVPTGQ